MRRFSLLVLLSLAAHVGAVVELTYSQLFDVEDFKGKSEVALTKCSQGCVLYAAAPVPTDSDTYQKDIVLIKKDKLGITSIVMNLQDLAQLRSADPKQPYLRKATPLDVGFTYSFTNSNPAGKIGALAIYVVASTIPNLPFPASVPVYDIPAKEPPYQGSEFKVPGNGQAFTVLSAFPFTLTELQLADRKGVSIRTTGYDGVLEKTCKALHETGLLEQDVTLRFPIRSPILTVAWTNAQDYSFSLKRGVEELINIELREVSAVTSRGYIGCGAAIGNFRTVSAPSSVKFNSYDSLNVSFTAAHDLHAGDWFKVEGNGLPVMFTGANKVPDSFYQDGRIFTVSWNTKYPESQWAVVLKVDAVLPGGPTSTPNKGSSHGPDTSTKAASAFQVTLLALISLLGAATAFH